MRIWAKRRPLIPGTGPGTRGRAESHPRARTSTGPGRKRNGKRTQGLGQSDKVISRWTMDAISSLDKRGGSNSPETLCPTLTGILDPTGPPMRTKHHRPSQHLPKHPKALQTRQIPNGEKTKGRTHHTDRQKPPRH